MGELKPCAANPSHCLLSRSLRPDSEHLLQAELSGVCAWANRIELEYQLLEQDYTDLQRCLPQEVRDDSILSPPMPRVKLPCPAADVPHQCPCRPSGTGEGQEGNADIGMCRLP